MIRNVVWIGCGEIVALTLFFLFLAVRALPRFAVAAPKNRLKQFFGWVDHVMQKTNVRVGGVLVGKGAGALPGDQPIVWRERKARALARPEHLMRIAVAVLLAVLGSIFVQVVYGGQRELEATAALVAASGVLLLGITACNSLVSERINQTHELLLTTPMSAHRIEIAMMK